MLKLEIKLIAKTSDEVSLNIQDLYTNLDSIFNRYNFQSEILNDGTHCYYGNGNPRDYGIFGFIITSLKNKNWFIDHASKWLWYNSDDSDSEDDFAIEDVLYHYTHRKSVA